MARPCLDVRVDLLPAAQVEIADAKIGTRGDFESLLQRGKKLLLDVIEYSWH
jgi:hypothetical protein